MSKKQLTLATEITTKDDIVEIEKCTYVQNINYIKDQYNQNPIAIEFLIRTAIAALKSNRADIVFTPYPITWNEYIKQKYTIWQIIDELKINLDYQIIQNIIKTNITDEEIFENLNQHTYGLIKFVIASNAMMIQHYNLIDTIKVPYNEDDNSNNNIQSSNIKKTIIDVKQNVKITDNDHFYQFKLIHTALKEDVLEGKTVRKLYHGSKFENIYSIMRNGLKIGTKSKFYLNGAAHGEGIYFSDQITMSLGYSNNIYGVNTNNSNNQTNSSNDVVLFICDVIDNDELDRATGGGIYVEKNENNVIIRYIINFSAKMCNTNVFGMIHNCVVSGNLEKKETEKKKLEVKKITTIHNKRLMKEYTQLSKKDPKELGFELKLAEEDNLSKWHIYLKKTDNEKLDAQMKRLGIPHIQIEIIFKDSYPILPPFIWILSPRFEFRTGHITAGGSLCMEMLTNQGWSPATNIESVIVQIKQVISDGDGVIDERNWKSNYKYNDAIDAYKRTLATHGWV